MFYHIEYLLCMNCMHYECIVDILWLCCVFTLDVLWMYCGCIVDVLWMYCGGIVDVL